MPTLHENRRERVVWLGLVVAGCLLLATCGGGASRVARTYPPPVAAEPPRTEVAATFPEPSEEPPAASALSPEFPEASEPLPAEPGHPAAGADLADADPNVAAEPRGLEWDAMTPEERATRLHFEGLEFESNRLSAEFAGSEEAAEEPTLLEELIETPIPEDYSLAESREEILRRTQSDLPLVLNSQVIKLINYFSSGRGLRTYRATMDRGAAYREMVERILEEEGVPKEMFHLAQAESGFLPKARSWARATGMWQFVSFRGRQYGLRQDRHVEERYDPEKATRAAARHLKDLYIEFGDWYLAMAAYNGGPGRVNRAIRRSGSRDYWTHSERRLLRRETRNYVPIILAFVYLTKNQHLYDVGTPDPAPALTYDSVTTNSEISFELVADLTDSTTATIRQLNPALLRSATPPFDYALRLPEGAAGQFQEQIGYVPEDKRADWRRHPMQDGETLADLAKRYNVKETEIAALNEIGDETPDPGTWLTIPAQTRIDLYGGWGRAGGFVDGGTGRYRIARGDTLGAIASRFGVSVRQLMAWNGLSNTRIRAGRYLNVGSSEGGGGGGTYAASSNPGPAPSGRYTVRRGDNLSAIASRHRVSVPDLKAWNGLRSNRINIGQVLRVPGSAGSRGGAATASAPGGSYRIQRGDNLATIASRFGVTVEDLKSWNGLRGSSIRAGDTLRVSSSVSQPGSSSQASVAEASVSRASSPSGNQRRYRIRRGDNLAEIAQRHNVTVAQLMAWNGLRNSRITAGDYLNVGAVTAGGSSFVPRAAASIQPAVTRALASNASGERYRIRRGDNLAEIAHRYNVSVEDLQAWNNLNGTRITAGEYLTIRSGGSTPAGQYRIRRGDTLDAIAKRFGVTVDQLKAWNGLRGSRIHEGQYLAVRPEASENRGSRTSGGG
jgi:membrane-bound lytic murein transglycosylase D